MAMPTCRDVTRDVASDEFENAGLLRRLKLRLHLLRCRHCRSYVAQLRGIGDAVREMFGRGGEGESERLERLEEKIVSACLPGEEDSGADRGSGPPGA